MTKPEDTTAAAGAPFERPVRRVRINIGALVSRDHKFGRWPAIKNGTDVDADMVFTALRRSNGWECRAFGYGQLGQDDSYGNGPIFVIGADGVTVLDEPSNAEVSGLSTRPPGYVA
jgi:hypothetical protein